MEQLYKTKWTKEYMREYQKKYHAEYRKKNKELVNKQSLEWYYKNRDRVRAY